MSKGPEQCGARITVRLSMLCIAALTLLQAPLFAQITDVTSTQSPPIPSAGHAYVQMLDETVNPSNGALSIRINVPVPAGRHLTVPFGFGYDSNTANIVDYTASAGNTGYFSGGGWSYLLPHVDFQWKDLSYYEQYIDGRPVGSTKYPCDLYNDYIFTDPQGGTHALYLALFGNVSGCRAYLSGFTPTNILTGGDGKVTARANNTLPPGISMAVSDSSGTVYQFSGGLRSTATNGFAALPAWIENRNGDKVIINDAGGHQVNMVDTLGRTVLAFSGFGETGDTVTVSEFSTPYKLTWGTAANWNAGYSISSDCTLSGCGACHPVTAVGSGGTHPVISTITLPNGTSYQFLYDSTFGVVNQIFYPNGGYVRYVWKVNPLSDAIDYYPDDKPTNGGNFYCHERYDTLAVQHRYVSADGNPAHEYEEQDYYYTTAWSTPSSSTPGYEVWNAGGKTTTIVTKDLLLGTSTQTHISYAPLNLAPNPDDGYSAFTYSGNCSSTCNTDGIVWSQPVYREYPLEQLTTFEDGSGKVFKTLTQSFADQYRMNCVVTEVDNVAISGTYYTWGAGDQLTDKKDYDFGLISNPAICESNSTPSATPSRETVVTYAPFSTNPIGGTILDRPSTVQVYGRGILAAEADYSYDGYGAGGITPVSATGHDDTNFSATYTHRGNATSKTVKCLTGSSTCVDAISTYTFDQTGQVTSESDPLKNVTRYDYTDSPSGGNVSGTSDAYLTTITDPLKHMRTFSYDYLKGDLIGSTDAHLSTGSGHATTYRYNTQPSECANTDQLNRLTEIDYPDGGETQYCYDDAIPSVTTIELQTPNPTVTSVSIMDGLGRVIETQTSEQGGSDVVNTVYDGLGHVYTTTNPFLSSAQPSNSFVSTPAGTSLTTHFYDALSRPIETLEQDGATLQLCYDGIASSANFYCSPAHLGSITNGTWVDSTDENGNHWQRTYDSFERLLDVIEPTGISQKALMETDYIYDVLGDLLSVNQKGNGTTDTARVRSFSYDSLSRLRCASNPEDSFASCPPTYSGYVTGTIGYLYDADGNLKTKTAPAPNQTGTATTVSSFSYDALNRLWSKSDSAGVTPISCYEYDTATNGVGRLSSTWTQSAGTTCTGSSGNYAPAAGQFIALKSILAYDVMGRPASAQQQHCIGSKCSAPSPYSLSVGYDLAGNVHTFTNSVGAQGSPLTLTSYVDSAGRPCLTTSSTNSWTSGFSPNLFQTNPSTSTPGYTPFGGLANWYLGSNSSSTQTDCSASPSSQMNLQQGFDSRLRVTSFSSTGQVP